MIEREIDATHEAWCDAYRRKDAAAVMALLAEDYVLWAPGREPMTRAELAPRLGVAFSTYDFSPHFERIELFAAGDLAVDVGWDVQQLTPRAGGTPITQRQRVCVMLRRDGNGTWRYARGMSQSGPTA